MAASAPAAPVRGDASRWEAESARLNETRVTLVERDNFSGRRGIALKAGVPSQVGEAKAGPDLVFAVTAPHPGRYWIRTHAAVDPATAELMRKASSKTASLRLTVSVDASRPASRVVFVPWSAPESCTQALGKFDFSGKEQEVRLWLPQGVLLDSIQVTPYAPPQVPDPVAAYQPSVLPPKSHPRVWVDGASLSQVRANLERGENAPVWAQVRKLAAKRFEFTVNPEIEIRHSSALEQAAAAKAFVHLMTGEKAPGLEAVQLMRGYLSAVAFDNLLDITREVGRAIYTGSLVYDWCYALMTPDDREDMRRNLMRLADDMEIGWPPFLQSIVNGHGNEAQLNRDLLAMSIAIYDEDPVPYRYCAYRILEELVPMRRFEYQSPRHNQGISYGPYRFAWDLHAAWLFRRMSGKPVFDDNIAAVYRFWLYMRLPDGQMLRDGDGFSDGRPANLGAAPLLSYAYNSDPVIKGDLERQGGLPGDPLLFLLLNDPGVKAEASLASLPWTLDFGPVLGSMIARTGWNLGPNRADVVVEMKGGGYHFGNHQHSDAGSFQIYYRGLQAVDLGQYAFYGTPYDSNFNKRSVAHSMMLAVDPAEKFNLASNDGGTRNVRSCPRSVERAMQDPLFANGKKISSSFGPVKHRPIFSYLSVDLKSAYSSKIQSYARSFCFLNLDNEPHPAALIVLDHMTTARAEYRKYWQVNTLNPPERTADGVILKNSAFGLNGKVLVRMLRPGPGEHQVEVLSGEMANSVFGQKFTPPNPARPEARGHRVLFSPTTAQASDVFLTVMSISDEAAPELPVGFTETPAVFVLGIGDRVVALSRSGELIGQPFQVEIAGEGDRQVLLCGLIPGRWGVRRQEGGLQWNVRVEEGENTAFLLLPKGRYAIQPGAIPGGADFEVRPGLAPQER